MFSYKREFGLKGPETVTGLAKCQTRVFVQMSDDEERDVKTAEL